MEPSLTTALGLSAVGMTLLFLALALFYGLLTLMMAVFKDRPSPPAGVEAQPDTEAGEEERMLQATAIAVALARAEAEQGSSATSPPARDEPEPAQLVSPWWELHHQRQLAPGSRARRGR
jgi:Na+-transporting methylmalonyl-CoA/oxaloacetate decarboxylase gamma subunit